MTDVCMTDRNVDLFPVTASLAPNIRWLTQAQRPRRVYDSAVLPGEAATADAIARDKARNKLVQLVQRFYTQGFSWSTGAATKISSHTAEAATAFFRILPTAVVLPKISPDGEDGLQMAWEGSDNLVLAVIDGWRIHLVAAATTPEACYLDDIFFDGNQIPEDVLNLLPVR